MRWLSLGFALFLWAGCGQGGEARSAPQEKQEETPRPKEGKESEEVKKAPPAPASPCTAEGALLAPGGRSFYSEVGSYSFAALSTGQAQRLPAAAFSLPWKMHSMGNLLVTYEGLSFGRDKDGVIYLLQPSAPEYHGLHKAVFFLGRGGRWEQGPVSQQSAAEALLSLSTFRDKYNGITPSGFSEMEIDAAGNLYVGLSLHYLDGRYNTAFLSFRKDSQRFELLATPEDVRGALPASQLRSRLRIAPDGTAWLFLWDQLDEKELGILRFSRQAGGWRRQALSLRASGGAPLPTQGDLLFGGPDWEGGWIYYQEGALYRLAPDGELKRLVALSLPEDGVTLSAPVILENGDIWIAFNWKSAVTSSTRADGVSGDLAYLAGDRSRWVRLRPSREGCLYASEVDAEEIKKDWRKSGFPMPYENLFHTPALQPDYHTGGLFSYDSKNQVLFSLKPSS